MPDLAKVYKRFHFQQRIAKPDIGWVYALREELATKERWNRIAGILAPQHQELLTPTGYGFRTTEQIARNQKTLIDAPRFTTFFDLDALDLSRWFKDIDVIYDDGELGERLFELFERAKLDWLLADCVMQLSSTHGLTSRTEVRAHLEYIAETPYTLAQQRSIAMYANSKFKEMFGITPFDDK